MKNEIFDYIDEMKPALCGLADYIFDHPELGNQEFLASKAITDMLSELGFEVQLGSCGLDTAFSAVYQSGEGGCNIGLLCEYDALEQIGHACGHHMQSPSIIGAAAAIKQHLKDVPFTLSIYGTPAEETTHGKLRMLEQGAFDHLDAVLMMHASPTTTTDIKSMATVAFTVTYHGKSAHAALKPEDGVSAMDAMLLAFTGIEFMREHVREDTRMHHTITQLPGPANVVPDKACGKFYLRSYSKEYLETLIERFYKLIEGASLMTGTTYTIESGDRLDNKIPVYKLNELLMKHAKLAGAPCIAPPREKTGASDFSNVMYRIPGSCIRVAFVKPGTSSHSQEYVDKGKSEEAHDAIIYGAKILAASCCDLITDPVLLSEIKEEFAGNQAIFK